MVLRGGCLGLFFLSALLQVFFFSFFAVPQLLRKWRRIKIKQAHFTHPEVKMLTYRKSYRYANRGEATPLPVCLMGPNFGRKKKNGSPWQRQINFWSRSNCVINYTYDVCQFKRQLYKSRKFQSLISHCICHQLDHHLVTLSYLKCFIRRLLVLSSAKKRKKR